jgi:catechol 2,3-dioxygenase-like lactoylglutathione lyase family enzyme
MSIRRIVGDCPAGARVFRMTSHDECPMLTPREFPMDPAPAIPPLQVRQIDHVTIVVKDLQISRQFYVDVLGMRAVDRPAFSFPGLWFQSGSTQVHLILEHAESGPASVTIPERCEISRTRHFAFEVEDAEAALTRLARLGVPLAAGPKQRPDGPTQFYITDPDGNLVELFSYPVS